MELPFLPPTDFTPPFIYDLLTAVDREGPVNSWHLLRNIHDQDSEEERRKITRSIAAGAIRILDEDVRKPDSPWRVEHPLRAYYNNVDSPLKTLLLSLETLAQHTELEDSERLATSVVDFTEAITGKDFLTSLTSPDGVVIIDSDGDMSRYILWTFSRLCFRYRDMPPSPGLKFRFREKDHPVRFQSVKLQGIMDTIQTPEFLNSFSADNSLERIFIAAHLPALFAGPEEEYAWLMPRIAKHPELLLEFKRRLDARLWPLLNKPDGLDTINRIKKHVPPGPVGSEISKHIEARVAGDLSII